LALFRPPERLCPCYARGTSVPRGQRPERRDLPVNRLPVGNLAVGRDCVPLRTVAL